MVIGVDFDNTIVRYDHLFHRVAVERGWIEQGTPARKTDIRNVLRSRGGEKIWTELQGEIYGPRMAEAAAFPGVLDFFEHAVKAGVQIHIISHKTRTAVAGPAHDLQHAAREWLRLQGFFDPQRVGLPPERLHFGETRGEKLRLIRDTKCTHFIDDLEETFREPDFPADVVRILFGAGDAPTGLSDVMAVQTWAEIYKYLLRDAK